MIAEILDIQDNCQGAYLEGEFHLEPTSDILARFNKTWKFSPILEEDEDYVFLYLLTKGKDLEEFSPSPDQYQEIKNTIQAQKAAAILAKVELTSMCFFDVLPEHQLHRWFSVRSDALGVLNTLESTDYDILHKIHVLTTIISHQAINFGENREGRVLYNEFGSSTGRLTTKKGSVPVLTLKKEQRTLLKPQNDAFVELDLNAAEIRMLMALSGREQPQGDIHEWVVENVFNNSIERSQAKTELFAWLYNPSNSKSEFDQIFSRQIFRDFFAPEKEVLTTPFGRKLAVDERKAQNYLLQSTTSDQVLENAYKIQKMLRGKKSTIAFTLHDSIILDMAQEDAIMLKEIKDQFEYTRWGPFVSTCKIGKDFGSLKEINL